MYISCEHVHVHRVFPQSMLSELNMQHQLHELTSTTIQYMYMAFGATLKIRKNPILIGISSNLIYNIKTCICIKKIIKIENSLLFISDKIWPKTQGIAISILYGLVIVNFGNAFRLRFSVLPVLWSSFIIFWEYKGYGKIRERNKALIPER